MKNYQDTENKIIGNLLRTALKSKSLHRIAVETGLSYVTVHKLIPSLIRKKLLKLEKKGKANLVSVDLENSPISNLTSAMIYEKDMFLKKYPQIVILFRELEEILAETFYTSILFGSYAKESATKNSDIDMLFIIQNRKDIEKYKEKINKVSKLHPSRKKHINIVAIEDFMDMLNDKYTMGRSVLQESITLFGIEQYYAMVKKYVRTKGY